MENFECSICDFEFTENYKHDPGIMPGYHTLLTKYWMTKQLYVVHIHPAGTSTDSDKCDLSKDSDFAPLTLGSMEKCFF